MLIPGLQRLLNLLFGVSNDDLVESLKILHITAGVKQGETESCTVSVMKDPQAAGIKQSVICWPQTAFLTLVKDCAIGHHILNFNRLFKWPKKKIIEIIKNEKPDLLLYWLNLDAR